MPQVQQPLSMINMISRQTGCESMHSEPRLSSRCYFPCCKFIFPNKIREKMVLTILTNCYIMGFIPTQFEIAPDCRKRFTGLRQHSNASGIQAAPTHGEANASIALDAQLSTRISWRPSDLLKIRIHRRPNVSSSAFLLVART